jgi:CheY-like chemotaxis protein
MSVSEKCSFFRYSGSDATGRAPGQCDLSGVRMICGADIELCEHSGDLRKRLLEERDGEIPCEKREEKPPEPSHYKVLVVDDQELMGKLIADILSRLGHRCGIARSGAEALDKMVQDRFDAVITDIIMPEMDGLALAKELLGLYPSLPIMIMTGHSKAYSTESVRLAGVRDYIKKSFSIEEFVLRFNRMMHNPMT